jgi:hypothetical protein
MGVDFESFGDVLKHPIRHKIVLALYATKSLSYTDLMGAVEASNTGKFNYHLKILGDLIAKDAEGKYVLSEKGQLAAQFLQKFPEKQVQPAKLGMADAALIGLAGVALTAANPSFVLGASLASAHVEVPAAAVAVFSIVYIVYGLVVPGAVMWLLTVRRAHSHDMYDLLKPAFVAIVMLIAFLAIMYFGKIHIGVVVSSPPERISQYGTRTQIFPMTLGSEFLGGIFFAFLGVAIAEVASRVRKKWALRH